MGKVFQAGMCCLALLYILLAMLPECLTAQQSMNWNGKRKRVWGVRGSSRFFRVWPHRMVPGSTCPRFWKCPGNEEKMARQVEEPALLEVSFRLWSSLHSWQQAGVWNNQDWMDKTLNAVNKMEKSWQEQKIFDLEFIENNRDAHHCRKWSLTQGVMDLWLNSETP